MTHAVARAILGVMSNHQAPPALDATCELEPPTTASLLQQIGASTSALAAACYAAQRQTNEATSLSLQLGRDVARLQERVVPAADGDAAVLAGDEIETLRTLLQRIQSSSNLRAHTLVRELCTVADAVLERAASRRAAKGGAL